VTERPSTPLFADEDGSPLMHSILDSLLKAALLHACGEAAAKIYTWHSAATRADVSNIQAAKSVSGAHRRPTDHRRERHRAAGPRRKRPLAAVRVQRIRRGRLGGERVAMLQAQRNRPIHDCHDARWPTIRRRARPARLTAAAAVATTRRKRHASQGGTRHNHHTGWNPSQSPHRVEPVTITTQGGTRHNHHTGWNPS